MNFFRELSTTTSQPICYNLLPHFAAAGQEYDELLWFARQAVADGRIRTFFISDLPVHLHGFPSLRLAEDILDAGGEPVVSLALSLHDRKGVIDQLHAYYRLGVRHFLFVTGDFPAGTDTEQTKVVFDIDSVQLLLLLAELGEEGKIAKGCVVSPFKTFESEQVWQYEKLRRKISLGADFIVTQLGYDIRKFDELLRFRACHEIRVPFVANMFITDRRTAELVQAGRIPGVKVPSPLLRALHAETSGRHEALDRAAKTLKVLKGLGYQGILLGSQTADFAEVKQVLDREESLQPQWQNFLGQLDFSESGSVFYYFWPDRENGLNSSDPAPLALKHFPSPTYSFSYFVDWLVYVPEGPLFKVGGRFCRFCSTRKFWYGFLWLLEYISKRLLYGCTMCGDCTLYACGFRCNQSGCPKKMLNGPCGGSIDGYCEVYPGKKRCYWVKVYHNMKGVRQRVTFAAPPIPPRDTSLDRTSSWINFFMGRDHRKMKFKKD